ncbi:ClpP/crotonase [Karstenula rhodostoma CBS 690.94]|uniref:ClpP/crotonase n=1 Tax=Karstenula rhodostoma CBS 690.94 TaxID=1392251 RepID=A0A9P4PMJ6_9PLEO|nr:ClpP/crotonase [Karstenula rhodostoma CBS 690.94]
MVRLSLIFVGLGAALTSATNYNHLKQSCINEACTAKRIAIHNPPVNLFNADLVPEFHAFLASLQSQTLTKVVVLSSANPDFFGDHLDLNLLSPEPPAGINATEISALDMRFAGPNAVFGAPEADRSLLHVGGLQQLVRLIGPSLAMEYLLSSAEVRAKEAERVGWVNKAFDSAEALSSYVDTLASRIAKFHVEVIRAHKEAVAESAPGQQALNADMRRFGYLASQSYFTKNLHKILTASTNQSRLFEMDVNNNIVKLLYGM